VQGICNSVTLTIAEVTRLWTLAVLRSECRLKVFIEERIDFLIYTRTYSIKKHASGWYISQC
jgi:hypothetical protein